MSVDYTAITELPQGLLTQEQMRRIAHRYHFAAAIASSRRVLEVACGAGIGLGLLKQASHRLCAIDYTQPLLHMARHHYGRRLPLAQADAQHLPFGDESFDLLLCFEAIYYLADYRRFLHEGRRVLASGGRLLLSLSNPSWPNFVPGPMTVHYPPVPELVESLSEAGFHSVQIFGILPTSASATGDRLRHRLRRLALQTNLSSRLGPWADPMRRVLYSRLHPLPAELSAERAAALAHNMPMQPVAGSRPDHVHRVLYASAVC